MATDYTAAAKAAMEEDKKALEQSRAEYKERMKGKPTPNQEECNMSKMGIPVTQHADDGSGPEMVVSRHVEAKPATSGSGGYTTRASTSRPASSSSSSSSSSSHSS